MSEKARSSTAGLVPYREGERCWVMTGRDENEWPEEAPPHFDSEAEAQAEVDRARTEFYTDTEDAAYGPQGVRQLEVGCLILHCADPECGEEFENDEFRHVHWPADDPLLPVQAAEDYDWIVGIDGQAYCPETTEVVTHSWVGSDDPNDPECSECGHTQSKHRFPHDPAESAVLT